MSVRDPLTQSRCHIRSRETHAQATSFVKLQMTQHFLKWTLSCSAPENCSLLIQKAPQNNAHFILMTSWQWWRQTSDKSRWAVSAPTSSRGLLWKVKRSSAEAVAPKTSWRNPNETRSGCLPATWKLLVVLSSGADVGLIVAPRADSRAKRRLEMISAGNWHSFCLEGA